MRFARPAVSHDSHALRYHVIRTHPWYRPILYSPHAPIPFDHEARKLRTRRTIEGGFACVRGSVTSGPWSIQMTYCPHCGQCVGATSCTALESCLLSTTSSQFSHRTAMAGPSTTRIVSHADRLLRFKPFTEFPDGYSSTNRQFPGCLCICMVTSSTVRRSFRRLGAASTVGPTPFRGASEW